MTDIKTRYERASRFLPGQVEHLVLNGDPVIRCSPAGVLYFARESRLPDGSIKREFLSLERDGRTAPLFDTAKLCALLGVEGDTLPFSDCEFYDTSLKFTHRGVSCIWRFADDNITQLPAPMPEETPSPNRESALFLRGHDLWLRRWKTGEEIRLTWDGVEDCDYGRLVDYDASITMDRTGYVQHPLAIWSPDSRKFLTFKIDMRSVKKLYAIEAFDDPHSESIRPRLHSYRCPFPEDSDCELPIVTLWLGDAEQGTLQQLDCEPYCFPLLLGNSSSSYARWLEDSSAVYFTWFSRGNKTARLYLCDAETRKVRSLVEESHDKFLNVGTGGTLDGFGNYRFSNFVTEDKRYSFWQSERDGLARLYRYNNADGCCEGAVTPDGIIVQQLVQVDQERQQIYFMANNLPEYSDPYYHGLCRVNFDGTDFCLLTPEDGEHSVRIFPDCLTDTWSRVDQPPVTVLRNRKGDLLCEVIRADISALLEAGYVLPERFHVIATDGETPLYGILIRPADMEEGKTYPFIDYIYGGMQIANVPKAFTWKTANGREIFGGLQEYAQLGIAGIILDGLGTPCRGRKIHDVSYENIHGCAGLADHVGTLEQIKALFPFLDLNRAGMWGNSGGGCATSRAMLEYPGIYKVGVASAGNHDQRMYENTWTERYYGLYNREIYLQGDNTALAPNLEGKLLLACGMLDDNVPMSQTVRLIDALQRADKDFDFILLPRLNHNVPADPYFIRRKMDYFTRWLLKEEPPAEVRFSR